LKAVAAADKVMADLECAHAPERVPAAAARPELKAASSDADGDGDGAVTTPKHAPAGALVCAPASSALQRAPANAGLPTALLAAHLTPQRVGDPLGLGVRRRPPAPADPDRYDVEAENRIGARALLSAEDRARADADIKEGGYWPIETVRTFVSENSAPGALRRGGIEPELMIVIDSHINYKIFIADDNIYTREELYATYAFHELEIQPEAVFTAQEIGVFPPAKYAEGLEYAVRDVGDERTEFATIEDLVGAATRKNYVKQREVLRIVSTKIYAGKDIWRDFLQAQTLFRSMIRLDAARAASGGAPRRSVFSLLTGAGAGRDAPLMIEDEGGATAEAARRQRADSLRAREEAFAAAVAAERAREAQVQARLDADIRRLEAMFAGLKNSTADVKGGPTPTPTPTHHPVNDLAAGTSADEAASTGVASTPPADAVPF
jgi:hypothetical protein